MQKRGRKAAAFGELAPGLTTGRVAGWRHSVFAFCVLLFAFLPGCSSAQRAADPNVITVAARVGPNSLHPLKANDEGTTRVASLIYESLMEIGEDLRAAPGLAERLEMPEPLTYIAHLRRGVRFHDGHELTAEDVVFTFRQFLDANYVSPYKGAFTVMTDVRAIDDYTVQFTLNEPFAAFPLANLVSIDVIPAHVDEAALTRSPVGTGPYRFVRYDVDDKVELAAFEQYWGGAPRNAGVVMKIIPDDTMRGLELRKGSADLIMNDIVPDIAHQLERSGDFRTVRALGLDFSYLGFNMRDPVLSDKRVRHAIGYAIDRDAITKYLRRDLARPATGLIPPQAWAYERDIFTFSYDPERAMRLLDEAGYRDPDGPDGPLPRLMLSLKISTSEEVRLQSTVIQENLRRVGIDLDLRSYEFATVFADILKGNFQMMSLIWVGGAVIDPDMLRRVFHSSQVPPVGFNRGYYSNAEVDRLIDLASAALTEPERKRYYAAAQKIIAEEAAYIPIWNRVNVMLARPDLDGLRLTATAHFAALKDVRRLSAGQARLQ
jgi:peptide/nickel transport system substrate-binding protein